MLWHQSWESALPPPAPLATHDSFPMSPRLYAFDPPRWQAPRQLPLQTGALFAGSAVWIALYGWLAYRLWRYGLSTGLSFNLALILLSILLGVALVLGWGTVGDHWLFRLRRLLRRSGWSGLTLEQLQNLSPAEFEEYVTQHIFVRQGYHAINTPDVKDGGIDVLVYDRYGQQAVVQCKRYRGTVGEAVVRDLYGTMVGNGATYAYLITTGEISAAAKRWAQGKPIELIDGQRLIEISKIKAPA